MRSTCHREVTDICFVDVKLKRQEDKHKEEGKWIILVASNFYCKDSEYLSQTKPFFTIYGQYNFKMFNFIFLLS